MSNELCALSSNVKCELLSYPQPVGPLYNVRQIAMQLINDVWCQYYTKANAAGFMC